MFDTADQLLTTARAALGQELPKDLQILAVSLSDLRETELATAARSLHTTPRKIEAVRISLDPIAAALGVGLADITGEHLARARSILGQPLLGRLAEMAFEEIYQREMGSTLKLRDDRSGYTDTDYLILNGDDRPVFRINIKFHGTAFQTAMQLVGLEPEDCFALATYKINQAINKQQSEVLPYVFAIVSVLGLTTESVGRVVPNALVDLAALIARSKMSGKRSIEDAIVQHVLDMTSPPVKSSVLEFAARINAARWRLISATRAKTLLLDYLFERVYAVRVRAFNRNYRNAEVDMHFSLDNDMTSLERFLEIIKQRGLHGVTAYLSSGNI